MPLDKPYLDIPGTTIFDAEQSRRGYWLNQFCMSLMKAENRARFKANERAYLDEWPMTEAQKQAVLERDLNEAIAAGGNIYFLAKIGATDGRSFQQMAASMTGMSEEEYREMMVEGRPRDRGQPRDRRGRQRAGASPAAGQRQARVDSATGAHHRVRLHEPRAADRRGDRSSARRRSPTGNRSSPATNRRGAGSRRTRPTSIFLVYNDHATAFSLDMIPTFAIGDGRRVPAGRRGLGPATGAQGRRPSGARLAHRPERDPGRLRPDHRQQDGGRPRPHRAAQPDVRPAAEPGPAR